MSLIAGNLGFVQRLFDTQHVVWGVCAGAAAHIYGNRRPIANVDILVASGQLPLVVKLLQQNQKAVQFDGQRILWRGLKFFDDLSIRRGSRTHPFKFDQPMIDHRRRLPLLGASVMVLAPEDILLHKLLVAGGAGANQHDADDIAAIVRRQQLDTSYLQARMALMRVNGEVNAQLADLGVAL